MNKPNAQDLRWTRIFDPYHIPKKYVEQIKERDWSVDRFFEYQKQISLVKGESGLYTINPYNFLYVLLDKENVVKGFCWMVGDILSEAVVINSYSIDQEYWCGGNAVAALKKEALLVKEKLEFDKIYWTTRCPKHSERHGFKRSRHVLMEHRDGKHSDQFCASRSCPSSRHEQTAEVPIERRNRAEVSGESGPSEPRAVEVHQPDVG